MQPIFEVSDVLERVTYDIEKIGLNGWQLRTLSAIKNCRTSVLGGHIDSCDACGSIRISYNSCRNRHCPKCQGKKREEWILSREQELLPVGYFHLVFTLPESLNSLAMQHPKRIYDMLFDSAWQTLHKFGINNGVQMGMIAILHTWGQNLCLHPHLHCIVPGGGIDKKGRWQNIRRDGKFLFPVKTLSKVFRAKYCQFLRESFPETYSSWSSEYWNKNWIVYAKRPFGSPKSVVEYLGRYTHKIAISNHRIQAIDNTTVTFTYKDYKHQGIKKQTTLAHEEFIRRFALHILPKRFVKIRHYGFLSSTWKRHKLRILQEKMGIVFSTKPASEKKLPRCPCCKKGNLHMILTFDRRGPPLSYLGVSQALVSCFKS